MNCTPKAGGEDQAKKKQHDQRVLAQDRGGTPWTLGGNTV